MATTKENNIAKVRNQLFEAIVNIAPQVEIIQKSKFASNNKFATISKNECENFIESILKLGFREGNGFLDIEENITNYLNDFGYTYDDLLNGAIVEGDLTINDLSDYLYTTFYKEGWSIWMPSRLYTLWKYKTESGIYPEKMSGVVSKSKAQNPLIPQGVFMSYVYIDDDKDWDEGHYNLKVIDLSITLEGNGRYLIQMNQPTSVKDFGYGEDLFIENRIIHIGDNIGLNLKPNFFINWIGKNPMEAKE